MLLLSVIIPTRNEAENLPRTLGSLSGVGAEIIVADAGSEDETVEIARGFECRILENLSPHRAHQLNEAAKKARGDIFLFLHADTALETSRTLRNIMARMERDPALVGGGLFRKFRSDSLWLRFTCWLAGLRGRWFGIFLGDQGIFVRREIYERMGGFSELVGPGEDLDYSLRLRKKGRTAIVGPAVISSARRFEARGPFRQSLADLFLAIQLTKDFKKRKE